MEQVGLHITQNQLLEPFDSHSAVQQMCYET
jgi:hypothetical protein